MGFLLARPPWSCHERSSYGKTRHLRGHRERGAWASRVMMSVGLGRPACWGRVMSGPRGSQALLLGGATEGSHQVGQHTKATGVSTAPEVLWDLHFHSN